MRFGIDISDAQGVFDWDKAEGVTFAVLKGGGGNNGLYTNKQFQRNYEECVKRGIDVGCYWFSKALTVEQAEQEAAYFFDNCLAGKKFTLPVYMDVEHKEMLALGKDALTAVVLAFCEALEKHGAWVGIYSSRAMFEGYMHDEQLFRYAHWVAEWNETCRYGRDFGLWQFGGETNKLRENKVAGVVCDQDYMLTDYPVMLAMNGKNDFREVEKMTDIERVVAAALAEVGQCEKDNGDALDDPSVKGWGNWTKYARDVDATDLYDAKVQGQPWCCTFVTDIHLKCFGVANARRMLCYPVKSKGYNCEHVANYYKAAGRWSKTPQVGAQIIFSSKKYVHAHTGIVVGVTDTTITTVEGNTNPTTGVVSNGGSVCKKEYPRNYAWILGYGMPLYDGVEIPKEETEDVFVSPKLRQLKKGVKDGNDVKALQTLLIAGGYSCGARGADRSFGSATDAAVRKYQSDHGLTADGVVGAVTWGKLLGA